MLIILGLVLAGAAVYAIFSFIRHWLDGDYS